MINLLNMFACIKLSVPPIIISSHSLGDSVIYAMADTHCTEHAATDQVHNTSLLIFPQPSSTFRNSCFTVMTPVYLVSKLW